MAKNTTAGKVCDLLRQPLDVRFIPLPDPMPANWRTLTKFQPGDDPAWRFRDVAFSSGVLKFVEVEWSTAGL